MQAANRASRWSHPPADPWPPPAGAYILFHGWNRRAGATDPGPPRAQASVDAKAGSAQCSTSLSAAPLRQNLPHQIPVHIGEAEIAPLKLVRQLLMVDAKLIQH